MYTEEKHNKPDDAKCVLLAPEAAAGGTYVSRVKPLPGTQLTRD